MRRRRLLGALTGSLAATSGCLTSVETPSLGGDGSRPPLAREDFVSNAEHSQREAVIPNVSLLSVSTATPDDDRSRVAPTPGPATGTTTDTGNESTTTETGNESTTTETGNESTTTETGNESTTTETGNESTTTDTGNESTTNEDRPTDTAVQPPDRGFGKTGLYVTDEFWRYRTHVHRYAVDEVTTTVFPVEPSTDTPVKVVVAASVYPRGGLVDSVASEPFRLQSNAQQVTVPMDLSPAPDGVPLQYVAAVVPESVDKTDIEADDLYALMETDPFVVEDGSISRAPRPEALSSASGKAFERERVEGGYVQTLRGRTNGQSWAVSYLAFESAYTAATRRSRGRARAEYVSFELLEGAANEIAWFLDEAAENNGFTGEFERIQFALSFVQRLPYVPDDVSTGYDDYTQFIMETLTRLGGDCEDTSILFASILESEPFNYDAVLLEPPGHMGVGLLMQKDFDGFAYIYDERQYFYVETTTEGWGIGQIPDQYRESKARIYDV